MPGFPHQTLLMVALVVPICAAFGWWVIVAKSRIIIGTARVNVITKFKFKIIKIIKHFSNKDPSLQTSKLNTKKKLKKTSRPNLTLAKLILSIQPSRHPIRNIINIRTRRHTTIIQV